MSYKSKNINNLRIRLRNRIYVATCRDRIYVTICREKSKLNISK